MGAVASLASAVAPMLGLISFFRDEPDEYNPTSVNIAQSHELTRQLHEAQAAAADAQRRAQESAQRETEARRREEEALQRDAEAREREENIRRHEEEARLAAERAQRDLELARQRGEESENRERAAREREAEAQRLAAESNRAALDAQRREAEANARVLETQRRESEARMDAEAARQREAQVEESLQQARFFLERGIQPEVWPTEEEFQSAKDRIQYDPQKLHFAVCGSSGSGKSSLVNALRGLRNNSPQAARAGVVETTMLVTRYPDPRREIPYNRLVWFDCPGAGTLDIPGWQYFNQQGLFIFDIVLLVYDARFTEIDVTIIQNCERFNIPLLLIRSKADAHIRNIIMHDLGYDENDDDANEIYDNYQRQARQMLIDSTRNNVERNLGAAGLARRDVFIVSCSVIYSFVTNRQNRTPEIDETRLIESVLTTARQRRYGAHASANSYSTIIENRTARDSTRIAPQWTRS